MTDKEIEDFAKIQFPESAGEIYSKTEQGIDKILFLRFSIDKKDLNTFLARVGEKPHLNLLSLIYTNCTRYLYKILKWRIYVKDNYCSD